MDDKDKWFPTQFEAGRKVDKLAGLFYTSTHEPNAFDKPDFPLVSGVSHQDAIRQLAALRNSPVRTDIHPIWGTEQFRNDNTPIRPASPLPVLDVAYMPTGKSWDLLAEEMKNITMRHTRMEVVMPNREPSRVITGDVDGIHPVRKLRQSGMYGTFGKNPRGLGAGYDGKLDWTSVGTIFPSDIPPFRLHPVALLYRGLRHSRKRVYYRASNVGKSLSIEYAMRMFRGFEDELADKPPKVDFCTDFIPRYAMLGSATGKSVHSSFYDYISLLGDIPHRPTAYQVETLKMLSSFAINSTIRKKK